MAAQYSFLITIREAEFYPGGMTVAYGLTSEPLQRVHFTGTLKGALAEMVRVSAFEPRSHAASLTMRYSTDHKPAGFDKAATTLRCNREEVPFV